MEMRDEILKRLEEHRKISEVFRRRPEAVQQAYANIRHGLDDPAGDTRRITNSEARDRALRILDSHDADELSDAQKTQVDKLCRRDHVTARRLLVTENEDYRSAWMKMVTDVHPVLTEEENRAVQAWYEFRALGDWTTTAGGFGIPVFIDPSDHPDGPGIGEPVPVDRQAGHGQHEPVEGRLVRGCHLGVPDRGRGGDGQ